MRARERKCAASASTNTTVLCLAGGDHILGNTTLYHLDYSLRLAKSHAQMSRRLLRRRTHFSSKLTAQHARSSKFTNPHTKSSVAGFCAPLGAALLPVASPALSAAEQWCLKSQSEAHPGICPSYEPRGKPHAETARSGARHLGSLRRSASGCRPRCAAPRAAE